MSDCHKENHIYADRDERLVISEEGDYQGHLDRVKEALDSENFKWSFCNS
jgi:hypothetical protein